MDECEKRDLVSVIVPVYNTELYLERCVRSLINQTYKNIEIILIEDASQDESLLLCKKLQAEDDRIILFNHHSNCGLEITRNDGINASSGSWIMFLDSDDEFKSSGIFDMLDFAQKEETDIVFSPYIAIINDIEVLVNSEAESRSYDAQGFALMCLNSIPWNVLCCIGSKIYRKSFLDEQGIRFDQYYKYNEDGAFMLMSLMNAKRIGYLNMPFYCYHIRNSGSIQSSYRPNMFTLINRTNNLLKDYLLKFNSFNGIRHLCYRKNQVIHARSSLFNEARYGTFASFRRLSQEVAKTVGCKDFLINRKTLKLDRALIFMIVCLYSRSYWLLFYMIRMVQKNIMQEGN